MGSIFDSMTVFKNEDGEYHREDGPAIIFDPEVTVQLGNVTFRGGEIWMIDGKQHRLDGPACIQLDPFFQQWWFNNRIASPHIEKWAEERNIDIDNLTEEDKLVIKVEWGNYGL